MRRSPRSVVAGAVGQALDEPLIVSIDLSEIAFT
jgi:hypothetical protein